MVLKLSSNVSDFFTKVLKLSSELIEVKPLMHGRHGEGVAVVTTHRHIDRRAHHAAADGYAGAHPG
jgi:hypothetical protein